MEYEDFHTEEKVEHDIREMSGSDFLINVKREFSDSMMMEVWRCASQLKGFMMKKEKKKERFEGIYDYTA